MTRCELTLKYPFGFGDKNNNIKEELNKVLEVVNHPGISVTKTDYENQQYIITIPSASKGIFAAVKEIMKYHNIKSYEVEFN